MSNDNFTCAHQFLILNYTNAKIQKRYYNEHKLEIPIKLTPSHQTKLTPYFL
ncbi:hypothetical protein EZS27_020968 [termite gut metagenome]|uniref:Uncharacterized protein n=1 Tax=termite gut metagenome TaxID=433724 RepID=A0A5J4RAD2_9ZZZZ